MLPTTITKKYTVRNLIFAGLLMCALTSCEDNETRYSVTPELQQYVESFYTEGQQRGKDLPKTNLIINLSNCQAITEITKDGDQWVLNFNTGFMDYYSDNQIEATIFHELGKIVLNKGIIKTPTYGPEPVNLMNPYYKFTGYSADQREALLDELFK